MNGNMAALNMIRKPKVEIEETMYPEDLAAQEQMAQPPMPPQTPPQDQMGEMQMTPEQIEMMKRQKMMG